MRTSAASAARYQVIQWLMFQMGGVGPMFGQLTHFKMFAPKGGDGYSLDRYQSEVKRLYSVLEKRLGLTAEADTTGKAHGLRGW